MLVQRVVVFFFQKLLQRLHRARVEPTRPALRLTNLRAGFFQGLVLEVVTLQKLSLILRELLDRGAHPPPHLLQFNTFICGNLLVADL